MNNGRRSSLMELDLSRFDQPVNADTIPEKSYGYIAQVLTITKGERSWIQLAGAIGASQLHVDLLEERRDDFKGRLFLEVWERSGRSSIKKLFFALRKTDMGRCLEELIRGCEITELERNALKSEFDSLMQTNSWRSVFPRLELFDLPIMPQRCTEGRGSHDPDETSHDMEDVSHDPEDMSRDLHENVQTERHQQACSGQDDTTPNTTQDPNSVFISYCPETNFQRKRKQKAKIADLVRKLQQYGYKVHYDRFCEVEIQTIGGLDLWKEACINYTCKHIIVVSTPKYYEEDQKILNPEKRGATSKVQVDCQLLRRIGFSNERSRLISVFLAHNVPVVGGDIYSPTWLSGRHFTLPKDDKKLLHCLAGVPLYKLPVVTNKRCVLPRVLGRSTDPRVIHWDCSA